MVVRLAPVHDSPRERGVDLHVHRTVRCAAIWNAHGPQATDQSVEFALTHAKAVVQDRKASIALIEIEREAIVHVDGAERTNAGFRPWDREDSCQQLCRRSLVRGWNDGVVKLNGHFGLSGLCQRRQEARRDASRRWQIQQRVRSIRQQGDGSLRVVLQRCAAMAQGRRVPEPRVGLGEERV